MSDSKIKETKIVMVPVKGGVIFAEVPHGNKGLAGVKAMQKITDPKEIQEKKTEYGLKDISEEEE